MSCPTCHAIKCVDFPTRRNQSLFRRLLAFAVGAESGSDMKLCTFCGTVYPDPDLDDDEADRISGRMSRLQDEVASSFIDCPSRPLEAGSEVDFGEARLCLSCGHLCSWSDAHCRHCGAKWHAPSAAPFH